MSSTKLSKRQSQILEYIQGYIAENVFPPSVREIGDAVGLSSPSTVHTHLESLEAKGYLTRIASKSRSVVLTELGREGSPADGVSVAKSGLAALQARLVNLPLIGNVAAGTPILAEENIEEEIPVPIALVGKDGTFMLRVRGNSMVDAGIHNGDMVVVKAQDTAENGQIVVALLDDSATVKRYYLEDDFIRLQPENASMQPIFTKDAKILGIVISLFRPAV